MTVCFSETIKTHMITPDLIRCAKQGDLHAFNRLVLEHQDLAFHLACCLLQREDTVAEEATQAAFLRAFRNLHQYRAGSFRAWLLHQVIQECKQKFARSAKPASEEYGTVVKRCLSNLPLDLRLVLVLVDVGGLEYREVASILEISQDKVRKILAQARVAVLQPSLAA